MLQLSDFAAQKQAEVISELVTNGFMRIYSGEQPSLKVRTEGRLVDCKILSAVVNGATITISWESAKAIKAGSADYYRVVTDKNIPVLGGKIGNKESTEEYQMEMPDRTILSATETNAATVIDAGFLTHTVFN